MPLPARQVTDRRVLLGGEAGRHEVDQVPAVAEHAERAVPRPGHPAGRDDDAVEHAVQVEVGADGDHRVEQRARVGRQVGTDVGRAGACPQRSHSAADRHHRPTRPVVAETDAGELAPGQLDVEVARPRRPRPRLPLPPDALHLVGVVDDVRATDRHHAPALVRLVVEVVDLERQLGVPAVGARARCTARCGTRSRRRAGCSSPGRCAGRPASPSPRVPRRRPRAGRGTRTAPSCTEVFMTPRPGPPRRCSARAPRRTGSPSRAAAR